MSEPPLSVPEMARTTLLLAELALSTADGNGGAAVTPAVRYTLGRVSQAAPDTAARLPHVRAALPPDVLAVVMAQARRTAATSPAPPAPERPGSILSAAQAAAMLGISGQAVRAAAKRGTLQGTKHQVTGCWQFKASDVERYGSDHGRR